MGCGRTNATNNPVSSNKMFLDRKINYFSGLQQFDKFLESNKEIENDLKILSYDEIEKYITNQEEIFKLNNLNRKIVMKGIVNFLNKPLFDKMIFKGSLFEKFIQLLDKVSQMDSDIKYLKETIKSGKHYFHQPSSEANIGFNLDLREAITHKLSEYHILSLIEQVKYNLHDSCSHLTVIIPCSLLLKGSLFIQISDLIENITKLLSFSLIISNENENKKSDSPSANLNGLLPIFSAVRNKYFIKNISLQCLNCKGELTLDNQNEIIYLLKDNIFSFSLSCIELNMENLDYFLERVQDMKEIKLFHYETPDDYNFITKNQILEKVQNQLEDHNFLEMVYLTGFYDCRQDLITNTINTLRKKGQIKNAIIDTNFFQILKKFLDD